MALKDLIVSARVTGIVMNYPLYDCGVSNLARDLIADGKVLAAIAEYRRLADLGSGGARCVLAYLYVRGAPTIPPDLAAAEQLAAAAVSTEPGYANYILSITAMLSGGHLQSVKYMIKAVKAGFPPALSAMAQISNQGMGIRRNLKSAEHYFFRAMERGHIPAAYLLCRFYMLGEAGNLKKLLGLVGCPFAWLRLWITTRFMIFSVRSFRHFNIKQPPMFNENALRS